MKSARSVAISTAWYAHLFSVISARSDAAASEAAIHAAADTYGEPEVVQSDTGAEVRLFGDVIPHTYAPYFMQGEAVSDVGFLRAMDRIPKDKAVTVVVNSNGGDVFAGTAIASAVRQRQADVHVVGIAASIASVVMAAGKKTSMALGATVMVHKPWSYTAGNAVDLRAEAGILDTVEQAMLDVYVAKSGKKYSRDQWRAALAGPDGADGSWLTGAQAVAIGIADAYEQADPSAKRAPAAFLVEQRQKVAALYCSTLPKHLVDPLAGESPESPQVPALGGPAAKPAASAMARRPGVSYLP